jgi:hypothetical protein
VKLSPTGEKRETAGWQKDDRIADGRPSIVIWKTQALPDAQLRLNAIWK